MSWHLHADYWVCDWFSPVAELNGYHVLDEGDNTPVAFHGADVASFGAGDDEETITYGLGFELRPNDKLGFRVAYEAPLTDATQLFGYRWTASAVLRF